MVTPKRVVHSSYFKLYVLRLRSFTPVTYFRKLLEFTRLSPSCNLNYLEYSPIIPCIRTIINYTCHTSSCMYDEYK
ncbi:hypothetical protein C5U37_21465 [Escherichia fergusonii]|nr:hypothetical protein DKG79_01320 [Escherichia fergusonii]PQI99291.1 hypothetical protein C5U37_21465 [Escherichia fergusonii]